METIINQQLEAVYPDHLKVLNGHVETIAGLSQVENDFYNRETKPIPMQVLFMVAIDVGSAQFAGGKLDTRSRDSYIVKPAEILEAAEALSAHYRLADVYPHPPGNMQLTLLIEDTAAAAVVELGDTLWNSLQIFLQDQQLGMPVLKPFLDHLLPGELDLLLEAASVKFTERYVHSDAKNIAQENARITGTIIGEKPEQVYGMLARSRQRLPLLLKTLVVEYRALADHFGVRIGGSNDDDLTVPNELLEAEIAWK